MNPRESLEGAVIGTAIGDALGLPREGLSPDRAKRLYGHRVRHQFIVGRGIVSDDTEHTLMVLRALARHADHADAFADDLARQLRWWLICLPPGIGFGTLRALMWSWLGVPADRSGVRSAGNGPAMRSAVIGVLCGARGIEPNALVDASTRITHQDARALQGALAIAQCAAIAASNRDINAQTVITTLRRTCIHPAWHASIDAIEPALQRGATTAEYAGSVGLGNGVSGYIVHSVPTAVYAWLRHPDNPVSALTEVIQAGGDTDSTAAVTGALVGARTGAQGFPAHWRSGLVDWPITQQRLLRVCANACDARPDRKRLFPFLLLRNVLAMPVITAHALWHLRPW